MTATADRFITLRKSLLEAVSDGDEVLGQVKLTPSVYADLRELETNGLLHHLVKYNNRNLNLSDSEIERLASSNEQIQITLLPHGLKDHGAEYHETLEDLIQKHMDSSPQTPFYIAELDYGSTGGEAGNTGRVPEPISHYFQTLHLIEVLSAACDHQERAYPGFNLIFLQAEKLDLVTVYTSKDLALLTGVETLLEATTKSDDKDRRIIILKAALIELLKNIKKQDRFRFLLSNFTLFLEKYSRNYELYLCDFSFEKLRSEFEKEKVDYIGRLNKVITDIQDKAILIPVGYMLIASQFESANKVTVKNSVLLLAALIFSLLVGVILSNQLTTLREIKRSIDNLKKKFEAEYQDLFERIKEDFNQLAKIHQKQKRRLRTIRLVSWLVAIAAVLLFTYYSLPRDWMASVDTFVESHIAMYCRYVSNIFCNPNPPSP